MRYIDDARHDVRTTFRLARRRPASTLLTVLLLALAIGTTTTLSSLIYGVLYRPLPWAESDRLVRLEETRGGQRGRVPWTISNATYLAWRSSTRSRTPGSTAPRCAPTATRPTPAPANPGPPATPPAAPSASPSSR